MQKSNEKYLLAGVDVLFIFLGIVIIFLAENNVLVVIGLVLLVVPYISIIKDKEIERKLEIEKEVRK